MTFVQVDLMDIEKAAETVSESETLADRLRRLSDEILSLWESRIREAVPASRSLDRLNLRNSIPLILETLAKTLEVPSLFDHSKIEFARMHGEERATRSKYSIDQVILEYRLLRSTIFDVLTPSSLMDDHARNSIIDIIDIIEVGIAEAATAFANYQYRLREQFILALAHDLRTPLTAAKASAQLILRQPEKVDSTQRLSARIVDSISRTDSMIEDLLDSNLVRTGGTLPLEIERSDLRAIIRMTIEETAAAVGNRFQYDPGLTPMMGYWDTEYLKRAIENVLINAVKYGDTYSTITVNAARSEQNMTISIHNYGPPIPQNELETIFDPFQRASKATTLHRTGWGIGLTLVKGICEAHGGTVSVQSQLTIGTTFTLSIPIDSRTQQTKAA